jgi:hypothetical protein
MVTPPKELPQMISIESASKILDISHWTLRTWLREGRLDRGGQRGYVKIGKRLLIRLDALEDLLKADATPATRGA